MENQISSAQKDFFECARVIDVQEELDTAYEELDKGTFIKTKGVH